MAAPLVQFYNNWNIAISEVVLRTATLKVSLHTSSYSFSSSHSVYADLTNELATANGYTNLGQALANRTWSLTSGVGILYADPVAWSIVTAAVTVRRAVLRAVGTFNAQTDPLILSILLDSAPADITVQPGYPLTITWDARRVFGVTH